MKERFEKFTIDFDPNSRYKIKMNSLKGLTQLKNLEFKNEKRKVNLTVKTKQDIKTNEDGSKVQTTEQKIYADGREISATSWERKKNAKKPFFKKKNKS